MIPFKLPPNGKFPIIVQGITPTYYEQFKQDDKGELTLRRKFPSADQRKEIFEKIKGCGFNSYICYGDFDQIKYWLNSGEKVAPTLMAYISYGYSTCTTYSAVDGLRRYRNNKSVKGIYLIDEPVFYNWGDVLGKADTIDINSITPLQWNGLSLGYKVCQELRPDLIPFWTLAVVSDTTIDGVSERSDLLNKIIGSCATYQDFLDTLQALYQPPVWSYDVYPVIEKAGINGVVVTHAHFYNSLKMFAWQSVKTGAPFWAYAEIRSDGFYQGTKEDWRALYPIPTIGAIRFEVFSALACGAQGIIYFSFASSTQISQRNITSEKEEKEYMFTLKAACEYSADGENIVFDDSIMDVVTTVNAEINGLQPVFLGAKLKSMSHAGRVYSSKEQIASSIGGMEVTVPEINTDNLDLTGFLMTELENEGKNYVMFVSHNPIGPQLIQLRFNQWKYQLVGYSTVSSTIVDDPNETHDDLASADPNASIEIMTTKRYRLEAGGYLIFERIGL